MSIEIETRYQDYLKLSGFLEHCFWYRCLIYIAIRTRVHIFYLCHFESVFRSAYEFGATYEYRKNFTFYFYYSIQIRKVNYLFYVYFF